MTRITVSRRHKKERHQQSIMPMGTLRTSNSPCSGGIPINGGSTTSRMRSSIMLSYTLFSWTRFCFELCSPGRRFTAAQRIKPNKTPKGLQTLKGVPMGGGGISPEGRVATNTHSTRSAASYDSCDIGSVASIDVLPRKPISLQRESLENLLV